MECEESCFFLNGGVCLFPLGWLFGFWSCLGSVRYSSSRSLVVTLLSFIERGTEFFGRSRVHGLDGIHND